MLRRTASAVPSITGERATNPSPAAATSIARLTASVVRSALARCLGEAAICEASIRVNRPICKGWQSAFRALLRPLTLP